MKRGLFLWGLLFCILSGISAQTTLTGTVMDKAEGKPLPAVMVTLRPSGKATILKFTRTDANGAYTLQVDKKPEGEVLVFTLMGFETVTQPLGDSTRYDIRMGEKSTQLKEVLVKAPSIGMKGDTILYNVSKYASAQDRTIGDVLKKMPGIEVNKNGAISYNGTQINTFYVDGKDLLGGKYNLATNTIHQKDVGTVEVMENHQPIRALEDISFSQSPAINLKLKESARSHWAGTVKAGAGASPFLWNGELSLMRFAPKFQTLNTYKTNNTGVDVSSDLTDHSLTDIRSLFNRNYRLNEFIDIYPKTLGTLDDKRSTFNRSHLVNTNDLFSLGKNYDLTVHAAYVNNLLTADTQDETGYFLNDGTAITTSSVEHDRLQQNLLSADVNIHANLPTFYLENKLGMNLQWNTSTKDIAGTYPNYSDGSLPYKRVSDELQFIRRFGKKLFELQSYNVYQQKPQHLTVTRQNGNVQHQDVSSSAFYTNTYTSFGFVLKPFIVSVRAGIVGLIRSMDSRLTGVPDSLGFALNDLAMRYFRVYASPEVSYRTQKLNFHFEMPLSYYNYHFRNYASAGRNNHNKLLLSPSLSVDYKPAPEFTFTVDGGIKQSDVAEQQFYSGIILNDYRNLFKGYMTYDNGHTYFVSAGIAFEKPLNAFFSRVDVSRSWTDSPLSSARFFTGDYILNYYLPEVNRSRSWSINGRMSKGWSAIKGTLTVAGGYDRSRSFLFQNGERTDYLSTSWHIHPRFDMHPFKYLDLTYETAYTVSLLKLKSTGKETSLDNFSQTLTLHIVPSRLWYVNLTAEHYYNEITDGVHKQMVLADAGLTLIFHRIEFNIALTNLFNRKEYAYRIYDGVSSLYRSFRLRPRNLLASVYFQF